MNRDEKQPTTAHPTKRLSFTIDAAGLVRLRRVCKARGEKVGEILESLALAYAHHPELAEEMVSTGRHWRHIEAFPFWPEEAPRGA